MLDCLLGKPGDRSSLRNLDGRWLSVAENGTLNRKATMNFWGEEINLFANRMQEIIKFRGAVFTKLGAAGSSTIAIPSRCVVGCRTHLVVYAVQDKKVQKPPQHQRPPGRNPRQRDDGGRRGRSARGSGGHAARSRMVADRGAAPRRKLAG